MKSAPLTGEGEPGASSRPAPELGTFKTVKARFWPWLEPFSVRNSSEPFVLFPLRSEAECQIGNAATPESKKGSPKVNFP